ncbi:hypothetical protein [Streptomyces syringium]|uniref:hypothetical protein n=1 Tax=Streptomyces syringium TaxID=76729 RepID=UPI0037D655CF
MTLWPWKMIRRDRYEALVDTEQTAELDAAETSAITDERDRLTKELARLVGEAADREAERTWRRQELKTAKTDLERSRQQVADLADEAGRLRRQLAFAHRTAGRLSADLAIHETGELDLVVLQRGGQVLGVYWRAEQAAVAAGRQDPAVPANPADWVRHEHTRPIEPDEWRITPHTLSAKSAKELP